MSEEQKPKPSLPESYVKPEIWDFESSTCQSQGFGEINRPYAKPRHDRPLPKGEHPLQLYSLATPNGQKVTILLEESDIEYDAWTIEIWNSDQFSEDYTKANPNQKIPVLLDYTDGEEPIRVFESASILLYIAERYAPQFLPTGIRERTECLNWLFWLQGAAPYIGGGFGHFSAYATINIEYAIDRYTLEAKRLLDVLDRHLEGKTWICGNDFTIADINIAPWFMGLKEGYSGANTFLQFQEYTNVDAFLERFNAREGVKRGKRVNNVRAEDGLRERHSRADFDTTPEKTDQ